MLNFLKKTIQSQQYPSCGSQNLNFRTMEKEFVSDYQLGLSFLLEGCVYKSITEKRSSQHSNLTDLTLVFFPKLSKLSYLVRFGNILTSNPILYEQYISVRKS